MIYWYGDTENSQRYQILSKENSDLKVIEDFQTFLKSPPQDAKALLVSESQFIPSLKRARYLPENLMALEFCDGFLLEEEKWNPKCGYLPVFRRIFSKIEFTVWIFREQ